MRPWRLLAVLLMASSLWPTGSLADEPKAWAPSDPRATVPIPGRVDALYLDWSRVEDWPRSLIARWRLDALAADSLALVRCEAGTTDALAVCRTACDQSIAEEQVARAHVEEDRAACEDALSESGRYQTWEVVTFVVGGVAVGVGVGVLIGWLAL